MLVEPVSALPSGPEWEYEYSWPGERVIAAKSGAGVRLASAGQRRDLTNRFPVIAATVAKLPPEAIVIDGLVRMIEPAQAALFGEAAAAQPGGPAELRLIATDLLWVDGIDVRQFTLETRRQRLRVLLAGSGVLIDKLLETDGPEMLAEAARLGADGVIAKRRDSRYRPFGRAGDWVRVTLQPPGAHLAAGHRRVPPRFGFAGPGAFGAGWGQAIT